MLSRLLRQLLFILTHLIVTILVAVHNVYRRLFTKEMQLSPPKVTEEEIATLLKSIPAMKKQIKHIVVLVDTQYHTMSDLARLVIWSLVIGVPYISFHDIAGNLKDNDETLFFEIQKNKKGIPGCIKWSNKPNLNGFTNGGQANTISINIFSYNDGKPKITQCIKKIAADTSIHKGKYKEFTAEEFNKYVSLEYPVIPDPDILLYTGTLCCTHGLLPWHLRLTEFIPMSIFHIINVNNYVGALFKYNKCDQRFGK